MRYGLYYGCAIPTRLPGIERATPFLLKKLGIDAVPLSDMACCMDPIVLKSMSEEAWNTVAARNLAVAAEQECDAILTLCNGCFCSLNEAARMLEADEVLRARVNTKLNAINRSYDGGMKVLHLAQLLDGLELDPAPEQPLDGRKVATFHGCHLVRPSNYAELDDPLRPQILDRLVVKLGAEVVPYSDTNQCCGMGFLPTGDKVGAERLGPILKSMADAGADWITTPCPSCLMQLETAQRLAREVRPLPVLHIAELFALALGCPEKEIGLKYHRVKLDTKPEAPAAV